MLLRLELTVQGPVVRRPITANPGLNFNLGFFVFCSKTFSRIIFSILFRASNHQTVYRKNKTEFAFYPFISELKFRTNPGLSYNSPLNNPAQRIKNLKMPHTYVGQTTVKVEKKEGGIQTLNPFSLSRRKRALCILPWVPDAKARAHNTETPSKIHESFS